jgi:small subunit ribosomal protein S21
MEGGCRLTGQSQCPARSSDRRSDRVQSGIVLGVWKPLAWKGRERELSEVRLKKGEPVDRALRRLKKKVDREGTLKEVRNHRHFEKPSEKRRRKLKVARFNAMLSARYADI